MPDPDHHSFALLGWLRRLWAGRRPADTPPAGGHPVGGDCPLNPGVPPLPMSRGTGHPVPPGTDGRALLEASMQRPVLFVFLRHFGCTFCREALSDLGRARPAIESVGTRLVLVHMSPEHEARRFVGGRGLDGVMLVSDPDRRLYDTFALRRGTPRQLLGWTVFKRGVKAGLIHRHGIGRLRGDGFQMPGVFLMWRGRIVKSFVHATAADRPDYAVLARMPGMEDLPESAAALG